MTRIFKGLVYVKHGRVGSRSEGPDYYLQTMQGDYLLHFQNRPPFQPDYHLEFHVRQMVEVSGVLQAPRLIEVQSISQILSSRLPPPEATSPQLGEPVTLAQGESLFFPGESLRLRFLDVPEDSRCPPDVVCIWAGCVVATFHIDVGSSQPTPFSLTLKPGDPDKATAIVQGYRVTLQNLDPASRPPENQPTLYTATLKLSKANIIAQ